MCNGEAVEVYLIALVVKHLWTIIHFGIGRDEGISRLALMIAVPADAMHDVTILGHSMLRSR